MTQRSFEEISIVNLADLARSRPFAPSATIRISSVHGCHDLRGIPLYGKFIRLTMTAADGSEVSMLWSREQWLDNMRDWAGVADLPSAPDTYGKE